MVNPFVVANVVKNALSSVEIRLNRLAGREMVPFQPKVLNIETSSLCNLGCRFCAYTKKSSPKVSMTDAFFADCVKQAVDMGFVQYELTPCTGDLFMDRHIFGKLRLLEENPAVEGYTFFTNFSIPDHDEIAELLRLKKLSNVTISIYGHDESSFIAIADSTAKVYKRLVSNLEFLLEHLDEKSFHLNIGYRTTRDARGESEITSLLKRFRAKGISVRPSHVYNNWGGLVTQADVAGLAIDVTGTDSVYKWGACSHLFTTFQIMATGIVNGCACRDVNATLQIGDLNKTPLRNILSPDNSAYMTLIDEQQRGEFRDICKSCDFYKSIYHKRKRHRGAVFQSVDAFKAGLRRRNREPEAVE